MEKGMGIMSYTAQEAWEKTKNSNPFRKELREVFAEIELAINSGAYQVNTFHLSPAVEAVLLEWNYKVLNNRGGATVSWRPF
jgi:hypothetical protein